MADTKEKKVDASTEAPKENLKDAPEATQENSKDDSKKGAKVKKTKAKRRLVQVGHAYVQASYNNTIITITEENGNVIAWASSGSSGFKGARKATPYAAQIAAENATDKARAFGLERIRVFVKGVGTGRDQAVRGLVNKGLELISINDTTPFAHNGCRKKKSRRV
ncbi:MAG: 30S ribosomal protein S11 [Candidatus Gracilibacteria bacterium]|jgi:small subunit ribosomal protein S11